MGPLTNAYSAQPVVPLNTAHAHAVAHLTVVPKVATYTAPLSPVFKAPARGVAATYAGLHSSHVGVCLNNVGVQVPCGL